LLDWITYRVVDTYKVLPFLFIYAIWIARNKMVFQDQFFSPAQVAHKTRLAMDENKRTLIVTKVKSLVEPCIDKKSLGSFLMEHVKKIQVCVALE
jgi:hypothetical protein